jgi:FPC/CPF motif-containing protein YcgG
MSDKVALTVPAQSSYSTMRDGRLVLVPSDVPAGDLTQFVHGQLRNLILDPRFVCVGAKAAFNQGAYRFAMYPALGSKEATDALARDLKRFIDEQDQMNAEFTTFVACFDGPGIAEESAFEERLWLQLQSLHDGDAQPWDPSVSADPESPNFSFSFEGRAFFIVGMHPAASRWARRFAWPTLVFNAHYQFERLRSTGQFSRFQQVIRSKDTRLQGSINPNLANFGDASEARQYSGRPVGTDWKCPFHSQKKD